MNKQRRALAADEIRFHSLTPKQAYEKTKEFRWNWQHAKRVDGMLTLVKPDGRKKHSAKPKKRNLENTPFGLLNALANKLTKNGTRRG